MSLRSQRLRAELLAEALRVSGEARLRVFGGSMWPWIRGGDTLLVRRAKFSSVRAGDIILYLREGRLFAHRVLRVGRSRALKEVALLTKGDALPDADAPVTAKEFLGRVVRIERRGRTVELQSLPAMVLGRLAARLSFSSRVWAPLAHAARRALPRR